MSDIVREICEEVEAKAEHKTGVDSVESARALLQENGVTL